MDRVILVDWFHDLVADIHDALAIKGPVETAPWQAAIIFHESLGGARQAGAHTLVHLGIADRRLTVLLGLSADEVEQLRQAVIQLVKTLAEDRLLQEEFDRTIQGRLQGERASYGHAGQGQRWPSMGGLLLSFAVLVGFASLALHWTQIKADWRGREIQRVAVVLIGGGSGALALFAIGSVAVREHGRLLGTGLLVGCASVLVGAMGGFLVGIPGTFRSKEPESSRTIVILERISDWLTKMVIGVGLVSMPELERKLRAISAVVAPQLGFAPDDASGSGFALAIMLYSLATGFVLAYSQTRLLASRTTAGVRKGMPP